MAEKEERQEKIIDRLKERAKLLKYGTISLILTIHDGRIVKGDNIIEKPSLG